MLSEASAFISLKTNKCRFLASLGVTWLIDFFTPSLAWALLGCPYRAERLKAMTDPHLGQDRTLNGPDISDNLGIDWVSKGYPMEEDG
jgi:hypothetical protein